MCVQVCPTGIDIRDGLQYECIGCAACVDACDQVMDKMNYPQGLIRYTTENLLRNKKSRLVRPRSVIYSVILALLIAGVSYAIVTRNAIELDVIRDRNVLYRELENDVVENVYLTRILNKDQQGHCFSFSVNGLEQAQILADGNESEVQAGAVVDAVLTIRAKADFSGSEDIVIRVSSRTNPNLFSDAVAKFIAP